MKKTLLSLSVLGAFAGSAMAADVTLYGKIDTGVKYTATDFDFNNGTTDLGDKHSFEMASGTNSGSRFGLKGTEDLGNGVKVGFVLENGFDSDDGSFDSNGDDKLFGREAILFLEGDFGKVAFGRMGIMNSTAGSFSMGCSRPSARGGQCRRPEHALGRQHVRDPLRQHDLVLDARIRRLQGHDPVLLRL